MDHRGCQQTRSIISSIFLLLNFLPLGISFIPLDHPKTIVLLLAVSIAFKYLASFRFWLILLFFSSSASFYLQWLPVCCSLRLKIKSKITKAEEFFNKLLWPSFHLLTENFFPPRSPLPKVPYTLIKLLQFFEDYE